MILSPPPDVRPLKAGHLARTVGSRTHHKRFWRPPRLPRNMRPYMDRNPACEAGPPARKAGVILFHQFRVLMCADEDFHLVCRPHQSSTPATSPELLCSSRRLLFFTVCVYWGSTPRASRSQRVYSATAHWVYRLDCHTPSGAVFSGRTTTSTLPALARRRLRRGRSPIINGLPVQNRLI